MTMNIVKIQTPAVPKSSNKEMSPKRGETFSDKLSASMKAKNKEEKPEASENQKIKEEASVEKPKDKEDVAKEKDAVDKEATTKISDLVPLNLFPEKVQEKTIFVEDAEIPVDGIRLSTEMRSESMYVLQRIVPADATAMEKITEPDSLGAVVDEKAIKDAATDSENKRPEIASKDFPLELLKASGNIHPTDGEGELKPALADKLSDETMERPTDAKGKMESSLKSEEHMNLEEAAERGKDPRAADKMIQPQVEEKSFHSGRIDLKPESEGALKADENILQIQVEKSADPVKAGSVSESIPKNDFTQNLEKATDEILRSMETLRDGDKTTMKLKLHPIELGKMEITLTLEEGKLSGKIMLDSHEARQLFSQRIDELNDTLTRSNIQVAKIEVGIGEKQAESQARQDSPRHMQPRNPFKGYLNLRKDEAVYEDRVQRSLEGIDLLA